MPTLLHTSAPKPHDNQLRWANLPASSSSLAIANNDFTGVKLVITPDLHAAYQLQEELQFIHPERPVVLFPDWEILPFDHFSAHEELISDRLNTLNTLFSMKNGIVIACINTIMHRLCPKQHSVGQSFSLGINDKFELDSFRRRCTQAGYHTVKQVFHHGECAYRGNIIDIFPMGANQPIRIELWD